jgi:hypothetical protein
MRRLAGSVLIFGCAAAAAFICCGTGGTALSGPMRKAARMGDAGGGLRAEALLVQSGLIRINIEEAEGSDKTCGISIYIREADAGRGVLQIRCGAAVEKPGPGVFDSVLGGEGPQLTSIECVVEKAELDFSPGPKAGNSACFRAETKGASYAGCFKTIGVKHYREGRGLAPR